MKGLAAHGTVIHCSFDRASCRFWADRVSVRSDAGCMERGWGPGAGGDPDDECIESSPEKLTPAHTDKGTHELTHSHVSIIARQE